LAEPRPFVPVKLICGIIASSYAVFEDADKSLVGLYGPIDHASSEFMFNFTDYYVKQMGKGLKRKFVSFARLFSPEDLSGIKLQTNRMEEDLRKRSGSEHRVVNLDPGYITPSALIMATAKDFAHRVPLQNGIYAHLEFLFGKDEIRILDWTYPDFRIEACQGFLLGVRKAYLLQLRQREEKSRE
jgi:hypothetical protein